MCSWCLFAVDQHERSVGDFLDLTNVSRVVDDLNRLVPLTDVLDHYGGGGRLKYWLWDYHWCNALSLLTFSKIDDFQILLGKIFKLSWVCLSQDDRGCICLVPFHIARVVDCLFSKLFWFLSSSHFCFFSHRMAPVWMDILYVVVIVLFLSKPMVTHSTLHLCLVFLQVKD